MKLHVTVVCLTGSCRHSVLRVSDGVPSAEPLPTPSRLEIVEAGGLFYLLRYAEDGEFCGDTCHLSLDEAKSQARLESSVSADSWVDVAE
jgi:hypothetical protein